MPWQQQSTVSLAAQPVAAGGPPAGEFSAVPIAAPFWGVVLAGDAGEGIADCRVRGRPGVPGYGVSAANSVTRRRSAAPAWLLAKMADTSIANSACRCVAPHNLAPHCAHGTPLNLRRST